MRLFTLLVPLFARKCPVNDGFDGYFTENCDHWLKSTSNFQYSLNSLDRESESVNVVQRGVNFIPADVKMYGLGHLRKSADDNCVQAHLNQYCRDIVAKDVVVRGDSQCTDFRQADSMARFIDGAWRCTPKPTHNSRWAADCVTKSGMTRLCRVENSNNFCSRIRGTKLFERILC